jgi:hypothetical protein
MARADRLVPHCTLLKLAEARVAIIGAVREEAQLGRTGGAVTVLRGHAAAVYLTTPRIHPWRLGVASRCPDSRRVGHPCTPPSAPPPGTGSSVPPSSFT